MILVSILWTLEMGYIILCSVAETLCSGSGWGVSSSLCVAVCAQCPSQKFQAQPALHEQPSWLLWFVSSALCMLSIFQSGRERWRDGRSRCQLSSGLSEVLCQIPLPAGLQAPRKLTRRRDWGGGVTGRNLFFLLFMLQQCYFHKRRPPWSLPAVIFFGGSARSRINEMDFTVCSLATGQQLLPFSALKPGALYSEHSVTHLHKYMNIHIRHNIIIFRSGPQTLPDSLIDEQCLTFWIKHNLQTIWR